MIQFLRNIRFDSVSFWIGFISGSLILVILRMVGPLLNRSWVYLKGKIRISRKNVLSNALKSYCTEILNSIQDNHIASSLFSLDEILIAPRLLTLPPHFDPDVPPPYEDVISTLIPFLPDWPELAVTYHYEMIDPLLALSSSQRIAIIGRPGIGKTTTLAYLASNLANQELNLVSNQGLIPMILSSTNITHKNQNGFDPLTIIIDAVSANSSKRTSRQLPFIVRTILENNRAVLILDGLDELSSGDLRIAIDFLISLIEKYPDLKIVITADSDHIDRLPKLGFRFYPIAAWGINQQNDYLDQWNNLWVTHIQQNRNKVDRNRLRIQWFKSLDSAVTPLEFTLRIWASYAQDQFGPKFGDSIKAYIRRMGASIPNAELILEMLALTILQNQIFCISENDARAGIMEKVKEVREYYLDRPEQDTIDKDLPRSTSISKVLTELKNTGILNTNTRNEINFVHLAIPGYLVGQSIFNDYGCKTFSRASWPMESIAALQKGKIEEFGEEYYSILYRTDDPLMLDRLSLAYWLPCFSNELEEKKVVRTRLIDDLENEMLPLGLRFKLLTTLLKSEDIQIRSIIRNLLKSENSSTRLIATIGCGYLRDNKATSYLLDLLRDDFKVGQAACLALALIRSNAAIEGLVTALLEGSDQLRRAAAEAFATIPEKGFEILREGSNLDDLVTRRAVIYGLRKVNEPWSIEILEKLHRDDNQWVIKDAAIQAIEDLKRQDPSDQRLTTPLHEIPWLVAFAGDLGQGLSPGKSAQAMLLRVLDEGNDDEILAALIQIQNRGITEVFPSIYPLYYGERHDIREAAYHTIWQISSMGVDIPPLNQIVN